MSSADDRQLLHAWTDDRDEAAFRCLVERYAGLVHGAALRRAGDAELAAEAAQDTFIRLARHAGSIRRAEALPAWLHAAAVHAAADRVRSESRHRERMKRYHQTESSPGHDEAAWREALPLLDDAIARLSETDRGLVLARYCQGESVAAAAQRYGLSPAAAQKRGERALEKLAALLRGRGVVLTVAALASGMAPRLAHAAPGGVAAQWSAAALSASPVSAGTAGAWFAFMNAKTVSIAAAVAAFCVPVGLQVYARTTTPTRTAPPPNVAANTKKSQAPHSDSPPPPDSRYIVNGVNLAALAREIRDFPPRTGRLQRELELRAAVQSLDGAQCAAVAEWLADAPGKLELLGVTEDLFRHWTVLDRAAAFAAGESIIARFPQTTARSAVQTQWAHIDPQGMLDHFSPDLKGPRAGVPAKPGADTACWAAIRGLAEKDPEAAIAAAQKIEPDDGQNVMAYALQGWSDSASPEAVLEWLGQVDDADPRKKKWYSLFIHFLEFSHPDKAWTSLVTWPDSAAAKDMACDALHMWACYDAPAAASAWLAGPKEWQNRSFAFNLAIVLQYSGSDYARKVGEAIPDPAVREYFTGLLKQRESVNK
jgi:RNA polymerase sigma factor (sigma-70 family)